jgi:hypothetical protein
MYPDPNGSVPGKSAHLSNQEPFGTPRISHKLSHFLFDSCGSLLKAKANRTFTARKGTVRHWYGVFAPVGLALLILASSACFLGQSQFAVSAQNSGSPSTEFTVDASVGAFVIQPQPRPNPMPPDVMKCLTKVGIDLFGGKIGESVVTPFLFGYETGESIVSFRQGCVSQKQLPWPTQYCQSLTAWVVDSSTPISFN